jgi:hypothetical protein
MYKLKRMTCTIGGQRRQYSEAAETMGLGLVKDCGHASTSQVESRGLKSLKTWLQKHGP